MKLIARSLMLLMLSWSSALFAIQLEKPLPAPDFTQADPESWINSPPAETGAVAGQGGVAGFLDLRLLELLPLLPLDA